MYTIIETPNLKATSIQSGQRMKEANFALGLLQTMMLAMLFQAVAVVEKLDGQGAE
ncbi:MAG: hypothetical protein ACJASL_004649 [Paraglaciecola sp.]|jgi:hypothetical protein